MKIKALFSRHRICGRCGKPIKQVHRWKYVRVRLLFWVIEWPQHRNCVQPHLSTVPHRKGDVPLPFPEPEDSFHTGENPA